MSDQDDSLRDPRSEPNVDPQALKSNLGKAAELIAVKPNAPGDDSIQPSTFQPADLAVLGAPIVAKGVGSMLEAAPRLVGNEMGMISSDIVTAAKQIAAKNPTMSWQEALSAANGGPTSTVAGPVGGLTNNNSMFNVSNGGTTNLQKGYKGYADGGEVSGDAGGFNPDAFLAQTAPPPPAGANEPMTNSQANMHVQNALAAPHDVPVDSTQVNQFDPDRFIADKEESQENALQDQYGTTGQMFKTAGEAAVRGVAGPFANKILTTLGDKPEDILNRERANPGVHMLGEGAGLAGSMFTGMGEGALAEKAAASIIGHAAPEMTAVAKIGSAAAKGAIENMIIAGGDSTDKMLLHDPEMSVDTAVADIGLAGLLGGGISGAIGSISPLWHATVGNKVNEMLHGVTDHLGGKDGVSDAINDTLSKHFPTLPPEVKAALSDDPKIRNMVDTLNQSDTTNAGRSYQESIKDFRKGIQEHMVDAFGHTPESLERMPEVNNYDRGKGIGETLASEYHSQIDPVSKQFESLKERAKSVPLKADETIYSPDGMTKITNPGVGSQISQKIGDLVADQAWSGTPEIMKEVDRLVKSLPKAETLQDLTRLQTEIGNNTASTLPFGQQTPLSRAGMMIKGILRDAEDSVAEAHFGEKSPELKAEYQNARAAYAKQAKLKDALDDRLHARGSIGGYAKGLREMAATDGESIVRKLSGKNDADLLNLLEKNFPKTANALKQYHVDSILQKALNKAKEGQLISPTELAKGINTMDPNLREFIFKGAADPRGKISAMTELLDKLNSQNHNFSNTARTVDKLLSGIPGSAVGMASILSGHSVIGSALLGGVAKTLTKDVPDAVRLSMLKFLGSGKEINSGAFKTMVDYFHSVKTGEARGLSAAKNVFKAGREVLPQSLHPTETDRVKLDKQLKNYRDMPDRQLDNGTAVAHYLPEHGQAMAQTGMRAAQYLNGMRPTTQKAAPLDSKPVINPEQKAAYNNALNIAHQPLIVLDKIKNGTLTPTDIKHLRSMYPAMYTKMVNQLTDEMTAHINKGEDVPYRTRIGLSMFTQQPLDSTMTPAAIIAAQPMPAQPPQAPQSGGKPSQASMKGMSKIPQAYQTPIQAREAARIKDKG